MSDFVNVRILTRTGALYEFPDMSSDAMEKLLEARPSGWRDLTLTNVSGACMVIPFRIIEELLVNGESKWKLTTE